MKGTIYLILCVFLSATSIFLSYLWISTTKYKVNNKEYVQRFGLPYGLQFAYHDYIYGGITICDKDEKIILSSGKKIGMEQVEVRQLLCYTVLPREKVLFKFLDGTNKIQYCSINRFHRVTYEQNENLGNCTDLLSVLRWIRFEISPLNTRYALFTGILSMILMINIVLIIRLFSMLKYKLTLRS
ncbi:MULTISPECIES: hypothetical protein [Sphingobacterium]|uniref:hypothetical protein n=1 Tax=Sphingobacterium TaxID=28453 RepID=UPI0013D9AFF6|nr:MULTISPECIES: hypothetical protein [unclassified Sphingobacterium]